MPSPTVAGKLEVEFVPGSGVYVDISARASDVSIDHPEVRPGPDDTAPTTLTATLRNYPDATGYCPFTPNNPAGAYYPNIDSDRRVRYTAIVAGTTSYVRFWGWADRWVPDAPDGTSVSSTVTLTASDIFSRYARRKMLTPYGEQIGTYASSLYYPFDEEPDASTVRVVSPTPGASPGIVVQPVSKFIGSATFAQPDGGHLTDGQIDFTRGDDNSPAPVLLLPLRSDEINNPPIRISGWFKLAADPKGSTGDDILAGYGRTGGLLWTFSVSVTAGLVTWSLNDQDGVQRSFWATGAPRDEGWHYWTLWFLSSTNTQMNTRTRGDTGQQAFGSLTWPYDPRPARYLIVGGHMNPFIKGKQRNTFLGSVSSISVQYTTTFDSALFGNPGIVMEAGYFRALLGTQSLALDTMVGGWAGSTADETTPVMVTTESDNMLDRWNELARSTGAYLSTQPDGKRRFIAARSANTSTVSTLLDANQDLHMPAGGWSQLLQETPTRVTVTSPEGTAVVVDSVRETLTGTTLEGPTVSTMGTLDTAKNVAGQILSRRAARLTVGMDVTVAFADKSTDMFANMLAGRRLRINNLPLQYLGVYYIDYYVAGWTETYTGDGGLAAFLLKLDPADDPPAGAFDDAEYGRFGMATTSTVTGGTCVGTTGTGTIIMTTSTPLATTAGNFPMDLDWNGERITISGVTGASSPQTANVTARGVSPSVARVHTTGEPVNIYHQLTFAF